MFPDVLPPLQQELTSWNDKLSHLHPKSMFRLEKLDVLPRRLLDLQYYVTLCALQMFGTARRKQGIKKENKTRYTHK